MSTTLLLNKLNNFINKEVVLKSPSVFTQLEFVTHYCSIATQKTLNKFSSLVNREEAFAKLNLLLKDIDTSVKIEASIFEFSYDYILNNSISENLFSYIYEDKLGELLANLDKNSHLENKDLASRIENKTLDAQQLAFYKPHDINPKRWVDQVRKRDMKEYNKNHIETTDIYTCGRCGGKKCTQYQMQTRSIDEPMTTFVTCLTCGKSFKK